MALSSSSGVTFFSVFLNGKRSLSITPDTKRATTAIIKISRIIKIIFNGPPFFFFDLRPVDFLDEEALVIWDFFLAGEELDEFSSSSMSKITGGMGGLGGLPF